MASIRKRRFGVDAGIGWARQRAVRKHASISDAGRTLGAWGSDGGGKGLDGALLTVGDGRQTALLTQHRGAAYSYT